MVTPGSVRMVLERLAADGTVVARSNGSTHQVYPIAVSMAEGQALRAWIVRERVSKTIEIGLGYAVSTLHICDGLLEVGGHDPRHLAIDPYQHSRFGNCGLQLLEDAGVRDLVDHVEGRSEILLPDLLRRGMSFDFAFIDGNHRFDGVFVDLFYLGRLVQPGGIIFVDDYQLPGVRRAVSFYLANLGWMLAETSEPHQQHQWAVLRTSVSRDERSFTYFVDF